jgi:hypothetical protein
MVFVILVQLARHTKLAKITKFAQLVFEQIPIVLETNQN